MLANGAKLEYKSFGASEYTELTGLKEIPEWGSDPERVENSTLADKHKQYEIGIGDLGEVEYKFKYDNSDDTSTYRIARNLQEQGKTVDFKETLRDGTVTAFSAYPSVKRTGGGVNGTLECSVKMILQGEYTVTDPE